MLAKVFTSLIFLWGSLAVADTLWFSSKRFETVIIQEETPSKVTFRQGPGVVSFPRSSIVKIEHDTPERNKEILASWGQEFFSTEEFVPEELKELAARFRELQKTRETALRTKRRIESSSRMARLAGTRSERLQHEQLALRKKLNKIAPTVKKQVAFRNALVSDINKIVLKMNRSLKDKGTWEDLHEEQKVLLKKLEIVGPETDKNSAEYSALIDRINEMVLEISQAEKKISADQKNQPHWQSDVVPYMKSITSFRTDLEQYDEAIRAENASFFDEIEKSLDRMVADLETETVAYSRKGNVMVVDVVLNEEFNATLMFDTGASVTTLSRELATRMGLKFDEEKKIFSMLADGSLAPCIPVVLDSVHVGTAVRENVQACIIDKAPGAGVDGLLGMSFLKYFTIQFNADKNKIELVHLSSGN